MLEILTIACSIGAVLIALLSLVSKHHLRREDINVAVTTALHQTNVRVSVLEEKTTNELMLLQKLEAKIDKLLDER